MRRASTSGGIGKKLPPLHILRGGGILILTALVCLQAGRSFRSMHHPDPIYPSEGRSSRRLLSSYFPPLLGTAADTDVYLFEGRQPGGRLLILGGSHPNEPAGFIAAVLITENLAVQKGSVLLVPQANLSGFSHNDPFEGNPQRFPIRTPGGDRWFRYGSRLTNPVHQWPDPALFLNPAGQKLAGTDSRNLNRSYPGHRNGGLTQKTAFAIMELIEKEGIGLGVDLHEAAPEYPVINAVVFHEIGAELAAIAVMDLQMENLEFRLEESPKTLRGLSHREWGDHAGVAAFLLESANASHGRLKGRPSVDLILNGRDPNYVKAARLGRLFVPFDESGVPLKTRVARHIAAIRSLVSAWNELHPDEEILLSGLPSPAAVREKGIGEFLSSPGDAEN
jgi:succinylglutamate desuccinylase/aspartoacylase family protein